MAVMAVPGNGVSTTAPAVAAVTVAILVPAAPVARAGPDPPRVRPVPTVLHLRAAATAATAVEAPTPNRRSAWASREPPAEPVEPAATAD
ncbi:hypothetical protein BV508_30535 [Mycobacterium intermedium]|nr:hypothetical protein BV508_30535 [Mycobacterium intermedium]